MLIIIINYFQRKVYDLLCHICYSFVGSIITHESLIVLRPSGTTKSRQVTRRNDHAYVEAGHQKLIVVVGVRKRENLERQAQVFIRDI